MTAETMFLGEGAFDLDGSPKTLECTPSVAEARIRNNTCVLSPETTQGTTRIFSSSFPRCEPALAAVALLRRNRADSVICFVFV